MRLLSELLSPGDEGWASFTTWATTSTRSVDVLPVDEARQAECLLRLQVTTRSVLGALAWHSGGVLLDHGWLRLLGGVSPRGLPDLVTASEPCGAAAASEPPPFVVIAHDVLGGRFAVNGGGLPCEPGEVAYFGPDTLEWQGLSQGNSDFVCWALTGDTEGFYGSLRWPGWEAEVQGVPTESGLAVYPPLFLQRALADLGGTSRRAVPWHEIIGMQEEMAAQLGAVPDGGKFVVSVEPTKKSRRWHR